MNRRHDRAERARYVSVPVLAKEKTELTSLKPCPRRMALFCQCELQYRFHYIDKLRGKYRRARPCYTMANHVHGALRDLLSAVPLENRTLETAKRLLEKNW